MTTELSRPQSARTTTRGRRHLVAPPLDPGLAHLSLPSVRAYRHMLAQEEFAATSWRRLIQVHLAALADDDVADPAHHGDPCPGVALAGWVHQLYDLDHELAGYRECAVERLARVTDELIARYHQDPSRCLAALPPDAPPRGA